MCQTRTTPLFVWNTSSNIFNQQPTWETAASGEPFGICLPTENIGVLKLELTTQNAHKGLMLD